jgi:hypothetical protein
VHRGERHEADEVANMNWHAMAVDREVTCGLVRYRLIVCVHSCGHVWVGRADKAARGKDSASRSFAKENDVVTTNKQTNKRLSCRSAKQSHVIMNSFCVCVCVCGGGGGRDKVGQTR